MDDMRTAFGNTAEAILDSDPLAAVVVADISADMFAKAAARHPDRVLNVGIREPLMISVGGGLSLAGMHPLVHSYAPFLIERSYEQIKLDLAHQGGAAVLVSVGASYDVARGGRTHHSPGDVALLDTLPGFAVHVPGHPTEVPALLESAVGQGHSSYIRLSATSNASSLPVSPTLQVVRQGTRALVVAVGPMLDPVIDATRDLDMTVAYATTVRPFDAAGLRALAVADSVVLVEPYLAGTSLRLVDEVLADRPHRSLGLGVPRVELRRYGTPEDHAHLYGLDAAGIRRSLNGFLPPA